MRPCVRASIASWRSCRSERSASGEEHDTLAPVRIDRGYRFTFGYTVDDLETVKELT